ncbi:helicase associated domain-containing protein [Actinacidiphila glaucinigra]|uniref:helicase associated domain-containing protein n=1 Tax=Actinacidiphila glaucinigra TaxID=235986 RepID=UPI00386CF777
MTWQRAYHSTRHHAEAGSALVDLPRSYVAEDGQRLGEWVHTQRKRLARLHPDQQGLVADLGLHSSGLRTTAAASTTREQAFQRGLAAARAFLEREGHLDVPQRHIEDFEGQPVRLGQWLANTRRRRVTLSPDRRAALETIGL